MALPLPRSEPCYFCQIIAGANDRWAVLEEQEHALTLLNGRQFEVGQCLIVSRRHAPTLLDLSGAEQQAAMLAAQRAARAMAELFDPDGILLYQNNGVGAGQEVAHFHLHVVPRREGSDWGFGPPHLAHLARARSAKTDFAVSTEEKRATARLLRGRLLRLAG